VALIAAALTTMVNARAHLDIPSNTTDANILARVEMFINAASGLMERYCDRYLKLQTGLVELYDGGRQNILLLRQFPIQGITDVRIDSGHVFGTDTIIDASLYGITDERQSLVYYNDVFPLGWENVKITYDAGFDSANPKDQGDLASLEIVCLWIVEWYYRHRTRGDMGRTTASKGDETWGVLEKMPTMMVEILDTYKRTEVPNLTRPIRNNL
jgi:hypothetical protein